MMKRLDKIRVQGFPGFAVLDSVTPEKEHALVRFDRTNFSPEDWRKISPYNAPCKYVLVPANTITQLSPS